MAWSQRHRVCLSAGWGASGRATALWALLRSGIGLHRSCVRACITHSRCVVEPCPPCQQSASKERHASARCAVSDHCKRCRANKARWSCHNNCIVVPSMCMRPP